MDAYGHGAGSIQCKGQLKQPIVACGHGAGAFYNMDKSRSKIVSFLMKIFPLYFPAGESVLAKRCRD